MQKWESYRHEINQSSQVGYMIHQQTQQIAAYKKAIDRINPAILQNVKNVDFNLHKGVSEVVVSQKQVPAQITKLFKDLNKAKTVNNTNNISTILFNLKNDNILDANKKLKEDWLNKNSDYSALAESAASPWTDYSASAESAASPWAYHSASAESALSPSLVKAIQNPSSPRVEPRPPGTL